MSGSKPTASLGSVLSSVQARARDAILYFSGDGLYTLNSARVVAFVSLDAHYRRREYSTQFRVVSRNGRVHFIVYSLLDLGEQDRES